MIKDLAKLWDAYCNSFGCPEWLEDDLSFMLLLIGVLISIAVTIYKIFKAVSQKVILWRNQWILNRDLHPLYSTADVERATKYFIPMYQQNVAPSIDMELGTNFLAVSRESPKL